MDAATPTPAPVRRSLARTFLFRFAFVYLLNVALQSGLSSVPGVNFVAQAHEWVTDPAARLFARHVLGIDRDLGTPNGSGDRTLNYVTQLFLALSSLLVALAWSAVDRRRHYRYLPELLRVALRYSLGVMMLAYGVAKLLPPTQFPEPDVGRLTQTYGESSPMGLLWTFMGASQPYTFFGGLMETVGGALLLFRRTTLMGALVTVAVMTNIVVLNFCYDVPVKLYSLHYLAIALLLAAPDVPRLFDLFVRHRPVPSRDIRFPLPPSLSPGRERGLRVAHLIVKGVFLVALVGFQVWEQASYRGTAGGGAGPLDGGYEVERFEANGTELPPLLGDAKRWRSVAVYNSSFASVRLMDANRLRFRMEVGEGEGSFALIPVTERGPGAPAAWAFTKPDEETVELRGTLGTDAIRVRLKKADRNKYLLVNRGFHWVNEAPYNR